MSEEKLRWKRPLSFVKGPFRFRYTAYYEANKSDKYWTLVFFEVNGHEPIKEYPPDQKIELVKKYGRQAARAAHEEAEKSMEVGEVERDSKSSS